jgi:hypothetical protein
VALFSDVIDRLLQPILAKIKEVFAPFAKVVGFFTRFWDSITSLGGKVNHLIDLVLGEIDAWKNFKENIAFRTKLISIPVAIDHVQEFWQMIVAAWKAVLDLVEQVKSKAGGETPSEEAEQAIKDIETSSFKGIVEKFPKLLKGLEKLLGFLAIILDALESIIAAVDDLTTILEALRALREDVESGGPLFLKQTNARKTLKLEDGSKIKIRVGSLHKA